VILCSTLVEGGDRSICTAHQILQLALGLFQPRHLTVLVALAYADPVK